MSSTHLVTGGAGFIGSHLCDRLLSLGHHVVAIDDLSLGKTENLQSASANPNFQFIHGDVTDPQFWQDFQIKHQDHPIDTIWHMAANSDIAAGVADATVDLRKTFLTTFETLEAARRMQVPRFALASTSAVYGELDTALDEESSPLNPISNYGAMKLASEAAATALTSTTLERLWIFRFPNVVGPRSTHGVIHDFVKKLNRDPLRLDVLGDGTQCKPYLHVHELVDAMLHIVHHAADTINRFLIGPEGGAATTVRHIAESVVRQYGTPAAIHYGQGSRGWIGDVPKFCYNIAKIKALGWSPALTSDEAIQKAVAEIVRELKS
jgi:UDP-glucose 4-epimerase